MRQLSSALSHLPARLLLGFVAVILVTIVVVGIPALRLVDRELEQQVVARLAQGASATRALYAARLREVQSLATLVAERPTLQEGLEARDTDTLSPYLETLRATAQLDGLVVLDASGRIVAQAPLQGVTEEAARALPPAAPGGTALVHALDVSGTLSLAIVAPVTVRSIANAPLGTVVGFTLLDETALSELNRETGLHHTLYWDGRRLATTLPAFPTQLASVPVERLDISGAPYRLQSLPLESPDASVVDVLALPAGEFAAARARVLQILGASTILVMGLAVLLAALLARRVTAPLQRLVAASEGMGRGDLNTPIPSSDGIVEVNTLAGTLEQMRRRLQTAYADLQRSKAWSENLIASLSEGVFTLDAVGRLTSFSPGAERILGWHATDVIGRPAAAVFQSAAGEPGAERTERTITSVPPGTVTRQTILTRSGLPLTLLVTSGAMTTRNDGLLEQAHVFRDVTEEERALRLRETLLASVSHEFKTPLAALRAAVELLALNLTTLSRAEVKELINSVRQGTLRLEELVDNLLGSASLHTGHFSVQLRPTDLEAVAEEVLLTTQPLLALQGQLLRLDIRPALPLVQADARRLMQVFVNLVSNASKYGPHGAAIVLRIEAREGELLVQVVDEGPGISPEVQSGLFQPFARWDEQGRSGMGLGLSIVKAIVERHGGTVGVDSAPGHGAAFWFTLPLRVPVDKPALEGQ